jgi:hypothetical protein
LDVTKLPEKVGIALIKLPPVIAFFVLLFFTQDIFLVIDILCYFI